MEESSAFHDWELLPPSAGVAVSAPPSTGAAVDGIENDSDGPIKSDYFSLDSGRCYGGKTGSDEEEVDSDNPSWMDPDSDSRFFAEPKGDLDFAGTGVFWTSDESSDGQDSSIDREEGIEVSKLESCLELGGNEWESEINEVGFGEIGGSAANDKNSGVSPQNRDAPEVSEERSSGNGDRENFSEKAWPAWWKLPLELLRFCAFRIRPAWSVSIAAALVGFVLLGRRLYRMKRKKRSISLKINVDDKVSQFMIRAARLNEAFSVVRRVPIIRTSLPASGVNPWPVMALR